MTSTTTHHPGAPKSGPRAPFLIDDGVRQVQVESLGSLARALVNVRDRRQLRIIDVNGKVWSHEDFITAVPSPDEAGEDPELDLDQRSPIGLWLSLGGIVMVVIGLFVLLRLGGGEAVAPPAPVTAAAGSPGGGGPESGPPPLPSGLARGLVARYLYELPASAPLIDATTRGAAAIVMERDHDLVQPVGVFDGRAWLTVPRMVDEDFSIAFWVQTMDVGGPANADAAPWYEGLGLVNAEVPGIVEDFGITLLGGRVAFGVGKPDLTARSTRRIDDGRWYHVAVERDNRSGTMALFLNGQPDQVLQGAPGRRTAPKEITIGAHSPAWAMLHGKLADVRFYNRQLTVREIAQLAGLPVAP